MAFEAWIAVLSFVGTLLLVMVGLLNFSVFWRQLRIAKEQIDMAVRQLEIAQKQPDLHLIQRAITETSDHVRLLVERPYLRAYFYADAEWKPGDTARFSISMRSVCGMSSIKAARIPSTRRRSIMCVRTASA